METMPKQSKLEPLLVRSEVKALLRCSARTVDRLVERGKLAPVKIEGCRILRFRPSAVRKLIEDPELGTAA